MPTNQNSSLTVLNRLHYQLQVTNAINLSAVDLSAIDLILADDTAAGATTVLTLPKMGTFRAPIGHRLTIRKASSVAQSITITPTTDVISGAAGAYPSPAATNATALPTTVQNSVTIQACGINAITGVPDLTVGPTVAGMWMICASSVASV